MQVCIDGISAIFLRISKCIPVILCEGMVSMPSTSTNVAVAQEEFHVSIDQRQLFLDDYGIAKIENLKRTMHQPAKKGAVIRPDPNDPQVSCLQIRTAPIWDPQQNIYKLWDCITPNDLHARKLYCSGYYESKDGLHWTKPVVGQIERNGSRENNYVCIRSDKGQFAPSLVVYDATDPDSARRYKSAIPNVGFAVSPDGLNWKMLDIPGVPSSDEYNFSFDEQEHLFILTVKHRGRYGRSVWLSASKDFRHWPKPELIFEADDLDQELGRENIRARLADSSLQQPFWNDPAVYNVDVYNMGVFRYEGLYIGMPAMYHATGPVPNYPNTVGFHLVQLTCSRDLKTWRRLGDRKPFIGPSPLGAGAYDLTQIIGPSAPVVRGDELWFYYTGIKYRGEYKLSDTHELEQDTGAICLATLRRDGFVTLDAGEKEGTALTQPFVLPKGDLHLNVDAAKGSAVVQVCDANGAPIDGFEASNPVSGNHPDIAVRWPNGTLHDLAGQKVCLRITLFSAQLYSYWIH